MKSGLNIYSVNKLIKTDEGYLDTVKKLKEIGYSYLQFSGRPFDVELINKGIEETGLPICLTHNPLAKFLEESDKLMEDHAKINCKNIGLGAMGLPTYQDENLFKETIEKLNVVAEKFAKNGFKFFYHNHHIEFIKMSNGQTMFDYMIENAPYFNYTLDTHWLQYGGVSVIEYIKKLSGKIECVHLKDYGVSLKTDEEELKKALKTTDQLNFNIMPVGDGNMNFKDIVKACKEGGTEWFLVEQDNACTFDDPLAQVKRSCDYIAKEL